MKEINIKLDNNYISLGELKVLRELIARVEHRMEGVEVRENYLNNFDKEHLEQSFLAVNSLIEELEFNGVYSDSTLIID